MIQGMNSLENIVLQIGAVSIGGEEWQKGFFPEDLPEDWQLNYYANEYSVVMLEQSQLESVEDWPEDLTGIIEVDNTDAFSQCCWVDEGSVQGNSPWEKLDFPGNNVKVWRASFDSFEVMRIEHAPVSDLRVMRGVIQQIMAAAEKDRVCLLLPASPAELGQIKTLVELLGG